MKKNTAKKLIIIGLIVIGLSPYVPDFLFGIVNSDLSPYSYNYADMRMLCIIPSIRLVGVFLALWGLVLKLKEKDAD